MSRPTRCAVATLGLCLLTALAFVSVADLHAHGTEARRVELLSWTRDRIVRVIGANRSELGLNGSKVPERDEDHRRPVVPVRRSVRLRRRRPLRVRHRRSRSMSRSPTRPSARSRSPSPGIATAAMGSACSNEITPERGAMPPPDDHPPGAGAVRRSRDPEDRFRRRRAAAASRSATSPSRAPAPRSRPRPRQRPHPGDGRGRPAALVPARSASTMRTGRTPLPSEQAILVHRYADETRLFWVAPQPCCGRPPTGRPST